MYIDLKGDLGNEVFSTVKPIVSFFNEEEGNILPEHLIEDDQRLCEILKFSTSELSLRATEDGLMIMEIVPLQTGQLRFEGVSWEFMDVTHRYIFTKHSKPSFTSFKILSPIGQLLPCLETFKQKMSFGEIQKAQFILRNPVEGADIDQVSVYSEQPLFTGFNLKKLGTIKGGGSISFELALRATTLSQKEIVLAFFYSSMGICRLKVVILEANIIGYFRIKATSEVLDENRRLVCVDLFNKTSENTDWSQLNLQRFYLLSNSWKLDQPSIKLNKKSDMYFITFEIIKGECFNPEWESLTRNKKILFEQTENTKDFEETSEELGLICTKMLTQENLELAELLSSTDQCSDFVDISFLWSISPNMIGLNSTSLQVSQIPSMTKIQKKTELPMVKLSLSGPRILDFDFYSSDKCTQNYTLSVDCSLLTPKSPLKIHGISSFEKSLDTEARHAKNSGDQFTWTGCYEQVIVPTPLTSTFSLTFTAQFYHPGIFDLNRFMASLVGSSENVIDFDNSRSFFVEVNNQLL